VSDLRCFQTNPSGLRSATSRLVLGQEAVADKTNETTAIPVLTERLAANDGLKGALVSIDAIATNAAMATTIRDAQADYLLTVKANQPTLRAEIEAFFADAPTASIESITDVDKGHGRIEQRTVSVACEVDWLDSDRRFPGEVRLQTLRRSSGSPHEPNSRTTVASRPDTTSHPQYLRPPARPRPCAAIVQILWGARRGDCIHRRGCKPSDGAPHATAA
jgi:predicted transposase YbfD/YdcC